LGLVQPSLAAGLAGGRPRDPRNYP